MTAAHAADTGIGPDTPGGVELLDSMPALMSRLRREVGEVIVGQDKVVDKLNPSNVYTYTPTQMVGATLVTFGAFVTVVANVIGASGASSKKAELAKKDAEEMGK